MESAVSKFFSRGGTHLRNQEKPGNTAHDGSCSAEMTTCAEDTGVYGCHECLVDIGTTDHVIDIMANTVCSELADLLCCAFAELEACIDNTALMAYASKFTTVL